MAISMAERLTIELRHRIITGELVPGTVVIEPALADEFKVSKTPVREALQRLSHEHLVQVLPKRGYLVIPMTQADLHEVLEVRLALEPIAAAHLAQQVRSDEPGSLEALAALRKYLDHQRAATTRRGSLQAATAFHRVIAERSGNSRLTAPLARALDESTRALYLLSDEIDVERYIPEVSAHEDMLAAIASGDPEAAREAASRHLARIAELPIPVS